MAQQTIGIGTVANDGTGDTARVAFDKVNDNFTELYSLGYIAPTPTGTASTDTDAFQAWVTACGANAVLNLVPGTTLTLDEGVQLLPGQKLRGNGATVTRVNQVATTTDTDVTSGVTTAITVASTTGLRVGQTIALQVGAATNYSAARTISDITGSVVTVSSAFNITSTTNGINVFLVFNTFTTDDDVEISGVKFDGNRANWTINRWDHLTEVRAAGNRVKVYGNTFVDIPSEGIQQVNLATAAGVARATTIAAGTNAITAAGTTAVVADASIFSVGDYVQLYTQSTAALQEPLAHRITVVDTGTNTITIEAPGWWFAASSGTLVAQKIAIGQWFSDNILRNVGGNPIHLSGTTGSQICRNTITNVNLDTNAGHRAGAICWSWTCSNAIVSDNYINGCYAGFGQLYEMHVSGAVISGNVVENASAYGLLCSQALTTAYCARDLTITGNTFRNCVDVTIVNTGSTSDSTQFVLNLNFSNNRLYNTELYTNRIADSVIRGNYFSAPTAWTTSGNRALDMLNSTRVIIAENTIVGGYYGLTLNATNSQVSVKGNMFSQQYSRGILPGGTTDVGVVIDGNIIVNDANADSANYRAIDVNGPQVIRNNNIRLVSGRGIYSSGGEDNFVVQGNTVSAANLKTIRVDAGSTGYIITDNTVAYAVLDNAGAAAPARVANNDVITIT